MTQQRDPRPLDMLARLQILYGQRVWEKRREPLDELVFTVLSQHTSDTNTFRTFASLTTAFPTWDAVASATTKQIEEAIKLGGLSRIKAPRIQSILAAIRDARGDLDLSFLSEMPLEDARN